MPTFVAPQPVAIVGATRGIGALLLERLLAQGANVIAIGRDRDRMSRLSALCRERYRREPRWRVADVSCAEELPNVLAGAKTVVHCAPPGPVPRLVEALPASVSRLVVVGSARVFTKFPDQRARDARAAEQAALSKGPSPTVLHPTMIYGASGERNVTRILDMVRRLPVLPLPMGGCSLVQPISCDDVVAAILAALERPNETAGRAITIAGPVAMTYAEFVRACARAIGRKARIVPVPAPLALAAARATGLVPFLPRVEVAEMRRLLEDKDADITPMKRLLGIHPVPFEEGLRRMLAQQ